jgi:excisionase family DNA binding protein
MNNPPKIDADTVSISNEGPLLLTIPEVCDALNVTRWSVYQLINRRRLKAVRIGRRRLIAAVDLATFVEELRAGETADGW